PREETPVDVNARAAGPRVVFPMPGSSTPPTAAPVVPSTNGTMPNSDPRPVKTFAYRNQPDGSAVPAAAPPPPPAVAPPHTAPAKPAPATRQVTPPPATRNQPASAGNAPLSLSPA